jgi:hypothetical protein
MAQTTLEFGPALASRLELERRAKLLAHLGNGWHLVEFAIALGAGIAAGSVALTSFAGDSLVEVVAASAIVWLFSAGRGASEEAERRAQRLVAVSYLLLVAYIGSQAIYDLVATSKPATSWVGVGLAAFTVPTMPLLARAKRRVGHALNSAATVSEAGQNQICAYLSLALLTGLLRNALAGWWWADPGRRARDRSHRTERGTRELARHCLRLLLGRHDACRGGFDQFAQQPARRYASTRSLSLYMWAHVPSCHPPPPSTDLSE